MASIGHERRMGTSIAMSSPGRVRSIRPRCVFGPSCAGAAAMRGAARGEKRTPAAPADCTPGDTLGEMPETSDTPGPPVAADGRATRWTGQQQRRRTQFVEAALVAIRDHGPDVSTEQIATQAGVARTRLYRHFAGAGELDQAIAARVEEMVVDGLAPAWDPTTSPATIIRTAVSTHLVWLSEHYPLYQYLLRHAVTTPSGTYVVSDVKRLVSNLLMRLIDDHVEPLGIDPRTTQPLAFGLVGFVDAAAARWVEDPLDVSLEEMVDLLSGWIWSSLDGVLRGLGIALDPALPLTREPGRD